MWIMHPDFFNYGEVMLNMWIIFIDVWFSIQLPVSKTNCKHHDRQTAAGAAIASKRRKRAAPPPREMAMRLLSETTMATSIMYVCM